MKRILLTISAFIIMIALSGCTKTTTETPTTEGTTTTDTTTDETTTSDGWIEIATLAEFQAIADDLDGKYRLVADIELSTNWTPIGSISEPFTGELDGQETYTISNLVIDVSNISIKSYGSLKEGVTTYSYLGYAGVFGYTKGAKIFDVTLDDVTINGTVSSKTLNEEGDSVINEPHFYCGSLVGYAALGTEITNVKVTNATISMTSVTLDVNVGGLVGLNKGAITSSNIDENSSITAVSTNSSSYVGGLIGLNLNDISEVFSKASVSSSSSLGNAYSGGLIGLNSAALSASYAEGNATSTSTEASAYSGGLIAYSSLGVIEDVYALGNTNASGNLSSYSGGLVGLLGGEGDASVSYSYAIGTAVCSSTSGSAYATGLIGYADESETSSTAISSSFAISTPSSVGSSSFVDPIYYSDGEIVTSNLYDANSGVTFTSASWLRNTLGLSDNIWNISEGAYPTL